MDKIFDAHVHVWPKDKTHYPPVEVPSLPLPEFDGEAERLIELMDAHGVSRALLVQTPWYGEDNRYLVDTMNRFPKRFAGVGYLPHPLAPDAPERLNRQYALDKMRGLRIHLFQAKAMEKIKAGAMDPLLAEATRLNAPIQFLYQDQKFHDVVAWLAERFPELILIVDHMGHVSPDPALGPDAWRELMKLSRYPKVYVKMSLQYRLSREKFPWADLHPLEEGLLASFGPKRLMWGSNFPMHLPEVGYGERLAAVSEHLPFLNDTDRGWILSKTAGSIWKP